MAKRRSILRRKQQLSGVADIVTAMRQLAFFETRKLSPRLKNLNAMQESIETATGDFLSFYQPAAPRNEVKNARLIIAFGSERGFCGSFNKRVAQAMLRNSNEDARRTIIAVGTRLEYVEQYQQFKQEQEQREQHKILTGALITEDIPAVLETIIEHLATWKSEEKNQFPWISALYHSNHTAEIKQKKIFPFTLHTPQQNNSLTYAPLITLCPDELYRQLLENYMRVTLEKIATESLMAENQARIQHMEGAEHYAKAELEQLARRYQQIRQDEITEEIELISSFINPAAPQIG